MLSIRHFGNICTRHSCRIPLKTWIDPFMTDPCVLAWLRKRFSPMNDSSTDLYCHIPLLFAGYRSVKFVSMLIISILVGILTNIIRGFSGWKQGDVSIITSLLLFFWIFVNRRTCLFLPGSHSNGSLIHFQLKFVIGLHPDGTIRAVYDRLRWRHLSKMDQYAP